MIDITKSSVDFYFLIPEAYEKLFREKLFEVWPKITVNIVDKIDKFSEDALKYQIQYKSEDPLSLTLDKRCNEPLNSILSVLDIIEEGDRVAVFYNFKPISQKRWINQCNATFNRFKNNEPLDKEVIGKKYIVKVLALTFAEILDGIFEAIQELFRKERKDINFVELAITNIMGNNKKELSPSTIKKKNSIVINTQMVVLSESKDKNRMINNANALAQSFYQLNEDNELIYSEFKDKNVNYTNYNIGTVNNKMSVEECQNLLELPGRELLERHKIISNINVLETPVPKELQSGNISIGGVTYKGFTQKAYLSTDNNYKNLTLCLIGPTRAGKTTLISNISRDSIKANECTILFDFCGNCDLSNDISKVVDNVLNIDCSNFETLQGLGYNEIIPYSNNPFEIYRCAKTKTSQLMTLINTLSDDEELKARMERYLTAAALVVFISNGSIKDIFSVLQNHVIRHRYIDSVPETQRDNLEEYIIALEELDEKSKPTKENPSIEVIGTKISSIQSILNRLNKLKQNTYMELMLKKDCSSNINLVEEIQKPQLICIRMPEIMFSTEQEKDIYCTYWLTKIWGALQVRKWNIKDMTKVNIVFDELYQVPSCQDFLRSKLSQIAKFGAKPIISCHYLGQINLIRNELKAANSSYLLISGCDKDNFKELKEELSLFGYTLEDLLNLKQYHSLNLIKYEKGYCAFISKLPPPINNAPK
jgi:uncharacterized protein YbcV (DUF1398 family)